MKNWTLYTPSTYVSVTGQKPWIIFLCMLLSLYKLGLDNALEENRIIQILILKKFPVLLLPSIAWVLQTTAQLIRSPRTFIRCCHCILRKGANTLLGWNSIIRKSLSSKVPWETSFLLPYSFRDCDNEYITSASHPLTLILLWLIFFVNNHIIKLFM